MAVANLKSKVISNRDATPVVLTDAIVAKGDLHETIGVERTNAASIDAGSTIKLVSVPSSARLSDMHYFMQSLGTSALDIAAWYPTTPPAALAVTGGALISSSAFVTNIQGVDTGIAPTDGMGTITQQSVVRRSQPLWQNLGLTSDPMCDIDLGFTVRTATAVQGYVGLRARYVR
jgi:hypothetical protein